MTPSPLHRLAVIKSVRYCSGPDHRAQYRWCWHRMPRHYSGSSTGSDQTSTFKAKARPAGRAPCRPGGLAGAHGCLLALMCANLKLNATATVIKRPVFQSRPMSSSDDEAESTELRARRSMDPPQLDFKSEDDDFYYFLDKNENLFLPSC